MKKRDIFDDDEFKDNSFGGKERILLYVLAAITMAMLLYIVLNFKAITVIIAATAAGIRW